MLEELGAERTVASGLAHLGSSACVQLPLRKAGHLACLHRFAARTASDAARAAS